MATGNNNNNSGNIDFSDNRSSISKSGVSSSLQNKLAKQKFQSDFYREGSGYLDNNRRSLEDMQKNFSKLEKAITSLNKEQQKSIQKQLDALQKWSDKAKSIKENQNVSEKEATKFVEKSNEARLNAALEYQKITREIANNQDNLSKKEKKFAESLKGELDSIAEATQQVTDEVAKQNEQIERTKQVLKETQSNFAKGISQTLKASSNILSGLVNMFNINSLANSDVNKFFSSKLDMQNSIMKTFSMDTKQQYVDFKSDLNKVLNNMGDLYNANDLTTFMSNLSSMGITDTNIAQQLMKSSIQATKYLGMSEETQQVMFKWMKRTNDYDMLDKHNKTIVGILKSNLGISAEQLDALTTIAYSSNETMSAIGMSKETISAVNQASLTGAATLYGTGLDMNTVEEIQKAYQDFLTADIDELTKYSKLGMRDVLDIQRIGRYSTDEKTQQQNFIRFIESIKGSSALMNPNTYVSGEIQKLSGALSDTALSGIRGVDLEKWSDLMNGTQEEIDKAMKTFNSTQNYIENTTELTSTDKIYNKLTEWFDGKDWTKLTGLAMVAFGLQASASVVDTFSSLAELKKLGGLKSLFSSLASTGKGMNLLSGAGGLLATGGGILLGVSAFNLIGKAIESAQEKSKSKEIDAAKTALQGTPLEGNSVAATALGISNNIESAGDTWLGRAGTGIADLSRRLGAYTLGWSRDLATINEDDWRFAQNILKMKAHQMTDDDRMLAQTAWELLLISAGRQSDISDFANISKSDLNAFMQDKGWSKEVLNDMVGAFKNAGIPYPNKSKDEDQTYIDWNKLNLDGYHKNGKDYIPRDGYHAILHKGEMVLNEREAEAYRKGIGGLRDINAGYPNYPSGEPHTGVDYNFPLGTPVGAAMSGSVVSVVNGVPNQPRGIPNPSGSFGNRVYIDGDDGRRYIYAHLTSAGVNIGDRVEYAQQIGLSGNSGNTTGPHLHFEVRENGTPVDPIPYAKEGLFSIGTALGAQPITAVSTTDTTDSSSSTMSKPVTTGRFIPASMKSSTNSGGMGGAGLVTKSLDNNFAKLIGYLNEIRGEQSSQREMLNTFSKLNADNGSI